MSDENTNEGESPKADEAETQEKDFALLLVGDQASMLGAGPAFLGLVTTARRRLSPSRSVDIPGV